MDHVCVYENDPPYEGQLMAIGLPPKPKKHHKRHLSDLPLLKAVTA